MRYLVLLLPALMACSPKTPKLRLALQTMPSVWKSLLVNDELSKQLGIAIQKRNFDSGAKVVQGFLSGDLDCGVVGSVPLALAIAKNMPLQIVAPASMIGEAEALVTRSTINSPDQIRGKKLATPFGSTAHFHLLSFLKSSGIEESSVKILNMTPSAISAAWKQGLIDGAYVWHPTLGQLKESGTVLTDSQVLGESGTPTFDAFVCTRSFLAEHPEKAKKLQTLIFQSHDLYQTGEWQNSHSKDVATLVGIPGPMLIDTLKGYSFPSQDQFKGTLASKLSSGLLTTMSFLKGQGKLTQIPEKLDQVIYLP